MTDSPTQIRQALAQITERAWTDEAFRKRLEAEGDTIAAEYGLVTSKGIKIKFHIDTSDVKNFSVPMPPPPIAGVSADAVKENLLSLARLHAEVACSTQWIHPCV